MSAGWISFLLDSTGDRSAGRRWKVKSLTLILSMDLCRGHPDVRGSRLSAVLCSGPKVKTGRLPAVSFLSLNSKHGTEHLWKLEFRVPMEHKPSSRPTAGHRPSHYFCPSPKYLRPSALCLSSSHYKLLALVTKNAP